MPPVPQASSILASLGQAAFLWDLTADTIAWSDNAGAVFTDIPAKALASGSAFARLIEPCGFDPRRGAGCNRRLRGATKGASPTGSNMAYGPQPPRP